MRAIYATIFLSMFLLNVAWGKDTYTVVDSENMTATNKKDMKKIIQQVCPAQRSQCVEPNMADDVRRRVKNKFSGDWNVIVHDQNVAVDFSLAYFKYLEVEYKEQLWIIFR